MSPANRVGVRSLRNNSIAAVAPTDNELITPGFGSIIQSARREAIGLAYGQADIDKALLYDSFKKQGLGLSPAIGRSRASLTLAARSPRQSILEAKKEESGFTDRVKITHNRESLRLVKQLMKE